MHKAIRTISWIATIVVTALVTSWINWNMPLSDLVAEASNLWSVVALVIGFGVLLLIVFWPKRWNTTLQRALIVALIIIALVYGGGPIMDQVKTAPWTSLLVVIAGIVAVVVLYALTINGRLSMPRKKTPTVKKVPTGTPKTTPIPTTTSSATFEDLKVN